MKTHLGNGVFATYDARRDTIKLSILQDGDNIEIDLDSDATLKFMEFIGQALHAPKDQQ